MMNYYNNYSTNDWNSQALDRIVQSMAVQRQNLQIDAPSIRPVDEFQMQAPVIPDFTQLYRRIF